MQQIKTNKNKHLGINGRRINGVVMMDWEPMWVMMGILTESVRIVLLTYQPDS